MELRKDDVHKDPFDPTKKAGIYSRRFQSMNEAIDWLRRFGEKYNPYLKSVACLSRRSRE